MGTPVDDFASAHEDDSSGEASSLEEVAPTGEASASQDDAGVTSDRPVEAGATAEPAEHAVTPVNATRTAADASSSQEATSSGEAWPTEQAALSEETRPAEQATPPGEARADEEATPSEEATGAEEATSSAEATQEEQTTQVEEDASARDVARAGACPEVEEVDRAEVEEWDLAPLADAAEEPLSQCVQDGSAWESMDPGHTDPGHSVEEDVAEAEDEAQKQISGASQSIDEDNLVDWDQAPVALVAEDVEHDEHDSPWAITEPADVADAHCYKISREAPFELVAEDAEHLENNSEIDTHKGKQADLQSVPEPELSGASTRSHYFAPLPRQAAVAGSTPRATLAAKAIKKRSHTASTSKVSSPTNAWGEVSEALPSRASHQADSLLEDEDFLAEDAWSAPPPPADVDEHAAWVMSPASKAGSFASSRGPGLAAEIDVLFTKLRLQDKAPEAMRWANEMGAATIDEVLEFASDLAEALALKPLEVRRLLKAQGDSTP